MAAANETGLLTQLENALPTEVTPTRPPLAGSSAVVRRRLLLTLLFLGAVGLHRTWLFFIFEIRAIFYAWSDDRVGHFEVTNSVVRPGVENGPNFKYKKQPRSMQPNGTQKKQCEQQSSSDHR